jgi:hypothetical protein
MMVAANRADAFLSPAHTSQSAQPVRVPIASPYHAVAELSIAAIAARGSATATHSAAASAIRAAARRAPARATSGSIDT